MCLRPNGAPRLWAWSRQGRAYWAQVFWTELNGADGAIFSWHRMGATLPDDIRWRRSKTRHDHAASGSRRVGASWRRRHAGRYIAVIHSAAVEPTLITASLRRRWQAGS